jgi:hypothetical protein
MYRRILYLAAMAVVSTGGAHLLARPATAEALLSEEYCCTSGNGEYTCCGTLYCSSNSNSCSSRDRDQ